jgi:hypothetical protein
MLLLNDDLTLLNTELDGKQLVKCTLEDWCVFVIKYPQFLDISQACQCSAHEYILTYIVKFQMTPLNVVLRRQMFAVGVIVLHRVECLKEDAFMKRNNTEFTNACSFTSFLVCGRILLLSMPIDTSFPWLTSMFAEISLMSGYGFLSRPTWCWLLFWWLWFIRTELNWILYF